MIVFREEFLFPLRQFCQHLGQQRFWLPERVFWTEAAAQLFPHPTLVWGVSRHLHALLGWIWLTKAQHLHLQLMLASKKTSLPLHRYLHRLVWQKKAVLQLLCLLMLNLKS